MYAMMVCIYKINSYGNMVGVYASCIYLVYILSFYFAVAENAEKTTTRKTHDDRFFYQREKFPIDCMLVLLHECICVCVCFSVYVHTCASSCV